MADSRKFADLQSPPFAEGGSVLKRAFSGLVPLGLPVCRRDITKFFVQVVKNH